MKEFANSIKKLQDERLKDKEEFAHRLASLTAERLRERDEMRHEMKALQEQTLSVLKEVHVNQIKLTQVLGQSTEALKELETTVYGRNGKR